MNSLITKRCSPIEEAIYQQGFQAGAASRDAEIAELVAQQCTSPFADSPPCRGIQRERDTIAELVALLTRYRKETPIGHQPHMISHLVDEALAKVRKP